jgi:hypothetical protein
LLELLRAQRRQVRRQVGDHAVPCGLPTGFLSSPNHLRIFAARLRMTFISTSLPPLSARWPVRSKRKEWLGNRQSSGPSPGATSSRSRPRAPAEGSVTLDGAKQTADVREDDARAPCQGAPRAQAREAPRSRSGAQGAGVGRRRRSERRDAERPACARQRMSGRPL